jgi:hypothetical protein
MAKKIGLKEFGVRYFDKRTQERGSNRNPIVRRERDARLKKQMKEKKEAIKSGEMDYLLKTCGITGRGAKSGIVPATVRLSKDGGFDTLKVLVHPSLKQGMTHKGRTILSINRANMGANLKMVQMGPDIKVYVHVFRIATI